MSRQTEKNLEKVRTLKSGASFNPKQWNEQVSYNKRREAGDRLRKNWDAVDKHLGRMCNSGVLNRNEADRVAEFQLSLSDLRAKVDARLNSPIF